MCMVVPARVKRLYHSWLFMKTNCLISMQPFLTHCSIFSKHQFGFFVELEEMSSPKVVWVFFCRFLRFCNVKQLTFGASFTCSYLGVLKNRSWFFFYLAVLG